MVVAPGMLNPDKRPARGRHQQSSFWMAPWPSLLPWWVMLGGVLLGSWVGFTPRLFVAMAGSCLLLGLLRGKGIDS